jgi:hypothetical protein
MLTGLTTTAPGIPMLITVAALVPALIICPFPVDGASVFRPAVVGQSRFIPLS